jgi:hypothetical protein
VRTSLYYFIGDATEKAFIGFDSKTNTAAEHVEAVIRWCVYLEDCHVALNLTLGHFSPQELQP